MNGDTTHTGDLTHTNSGPAFLQHNGPFGKTEESLDTTLNSIKEEDGANRRLAEAEDKSLDNKRVFFIGALVICTAVLAGVAYWLKEYPAEYKDSEAWITLIINAMTAYSFVLGFWWWEESKHDVKLQRKAADDAALKTDTDRVKADKNLNNILKLVNDNLEALKVLLVPILEEKSNTGKVLDLVRDGGFQKPSAGAPDSMAMKQQILLALKQNGPLLYDQMLLPDLREADLSALLGTLLVDEQVVVTPNGLWNLKGNQSA